MVPEKFSSFTGIFGIKLILETWVFERERFDVYIRPFLRAESHTASD